MADNVTLDAGSGGAVIAADDISSVWYQRVKLTDGTADSSTFIHAGGGVEANALRVTIASDSTGVVTVDGTVTANLSATDNAVLDTIDAVLDTINAKLVTGTVIGDVNLGATDNAVLDAIAASLAATLTVDGSGVTQPVSGTVTANLSATDNAVLDTIDAVLDTINAKLVTGTVIGDVNLGATDNAVLDSIVTNTTGLAGTVSGSELQVDVVAALPTGANVVGQVGLEPRTSGGNSFVRTLDLDESAAVQIKDTAGQLYSIFFTNTNASVRFLKIYNVADTSVTVGTTTPSLTFQIPPDNGGLHLSWPHGLEFDTAMSMAATTGVADNDTGAPGANEIVGMVEYQ